MSDDRGRFSCLLVFIAAAVVVIGAFVAFPFLRIFPGIFFSVRNIKNQESKMQSPEVYNQAGPSLALYCQTGPALFPTGFVGNAWLPKVIRDLEPSRTVITESNAGVMMGGGFAHWGYILERQAGRDPKSNTWTLQFRNDQPSQKLLSTFSTSVSEKIAMSNFVADALGEYGRRSKIKQEYEINALWLEQERLAFLIQYDPSKICEACTQSIQDLPGHWWPRLTLAFIESGIGRYDQGAAELESWVAARPSYSRYIYLAYFFQKMEKPDQAVNAIEKALTFPVIDLDDDMANAECRGYSAGVYAYRAEKYATVIKLCDALLPLKENGDFAKHALGNLRSAAVAAQASTGTVFKPDDRVLGFNPYDHVSLDDLRSSAVSNAVAHVSQ